MKPEETVEALLAYGLLVIVVALMFPVPKLYVGITLTVIYSVWVIVTFFKKPLMAIIFGVFMITPILAVILPPVTPAGILPLFKLAISLIVWGGIISVLTSAAIVLASRKERSQD